MKEPQSRFDIAHHTGLKLPIISRITMEMLQCGLLEEHKAITEESRRGRRQSTLSIRGDSAYVVSIAMSAYSQDVILSNLKGHIVHAKPLPDIFSVKPEAVLEKMLAAMITIVEENRIPRHRLLGGGIIAPSHMLFSASDNTSAVSMTVTPEFLNKLQEGLAVPVIGMRLANALNLAENQCGVTQDHEHVLYLHLSMVTGCSLLQKRKLLFDANRIGIMHSMPIAHPHCCHNPLPRISTHASGMSVLQRLGILPQNANPLLYSVQDNLNLSIAHSKSLHNDQEACNAFADAGQWMGYALETLSQVYHPDIIVLSGPLANNAHYRDAMQSAWLAQKSGHENVTLQSATLSLAAGAAITVLSEHIKSHNLDISQLIQD